MDVPMEKQILRLRHRLTEPSDTPYGKNLFPGISSNGLGFVQKCT